jgi:MFS transporter, DHA1 family, multidrug resistance protein
MADFIKETSAGQFLRLLGFQQPWLLYPEENPGFKPAGTPVGCENHPSVVEKDLEKMLSTVSAAKVPSEETTTPPVESSEKEIIIVSWSENDAANPRNWAHSKKMWTLTVVNLYTFCVYCSASIITPTAEAIMARYDVSLVVASLGLSMYVVGCE